MTERQALVRAMLAEPDDDLPRLVFADWLDEHGEPERAEFVRAQIEADRHTGAAREPLLNRANELLRAKRGDWLGPAGGYATTPGLPEFDRGMPSRLAIGEDEFVRPAVQERLTPWAGDNGIGHLEFRPALSAGDPWAAARALVGTLVARLRGDDPGPIVPTSQIVNSPVLAFAAAATLDGYSTADPCLLTFTRSPHVGLLSGLTFRLPHCTDGGLNTLARCTTLPNLRSLDLTVYATTPRYVADRPRFTAEGVLKVLASDRLPRFHALGLTGDLPRRFDLARVLNHPAAGRLTRLRLESADAFRLIARSRQLARLRTVIFSGRYVTVDGESVAELLTNRALPALRSLWLLNPDGANVRLTADDEARLRDRFGIGYMRFPG